MAINRIEGQIWIDRNSPNRLKYYVNGHEYSVEVSGNYPAYTASESATFYCGTVVKLNKAGQLVAAKFPGDISDVLGVIGQTVQGSLGTEIPVTKNGWIRIYKSNPYFTSINEFENVFADYDQSYWDWENTSNLIKLTGAPVYWCLDSNKAGKLTLSTPSGFYWTKEARESNTNYISYNNLPQIGNISRVDKTEGVIEIHVNFSKFDSTLEWSWPSMKLAGENAVDLGEDLGEDYKRRLEIRHGFIVPSKFLPQTFHHITCVKDGDTNNIENEVVGKISENYGLGTCIIIVSSPYTMKYKVSGETNFRLNMSQSAS